MRLVRVRVALFALCALHGAQAATWYVATNGSDAADGTTWLTAKQTIQAAIDLSASGDTVLVSNGVYGTGGRVVHGAMSNRVVIDKILRVQSVNGPRDTVIVGAGPRGDAAVRCAYVGSNAVLSGFTLTNGATRMAGDHFLEQSGGGAWCETNAVVENCWLTGGAAAYGGGAYRGLLDRCRLFGNTATNGGGANAALLTSCLLYGNLGVAGGGTYASEVRNCTLVDNRATEGGGTRGGTMYNSVAYYNTAPTGPNFFGNTVVAYSCTTPPAGGVGDFTNAPLMAGLANPHLLAGSPCIDAGTNAYAGGTDLDGQPRLAGLRVDVGCDEFTMPATGPLAVQVVPGQTNLVRGFPTSFEGNVEGVPETLRWWWGDGAITSNQFRAGHAFAATGRYAIVLQAANADGIAAATVTVEVAEFTYHVAPGGGHVPPFADWATAATSIQAAVDVALPGARVLVSNGVYDTGGRVVYGALTNRIAITNSITVQSVNGPAVTTIVGVWDPVTTNGDAAVRCVYLGTNSTLVGFTLTNGAVRGSGDTLRERSGGGLWAETNAVVSNCVLVGNAASYGGGSHGGVLQGCQLIGNFATQYGGGSQTSALHNCLLTGNRAVLGGGTHGAALYGCTVIGNTASGLGGGALRGNLFNTIVFHNQAPNAPNVFSASTTVCCTTPDAGGTGNVTNQPLVASAANPHLLDGSPCRNVGSNLYASGWDLDGEPRMDGEVVDIGCDEFTPPVSGPLAARIRSFPTNVTAGLHIFVEAEVDGAPTRLTWEWGDGSATTNLFRSAHAYAAAGTYPVVLQVTNASGSASVTVMVQVAVQPIHYVAPGGGHVPPFANWSDAATNIQSALDVASAGALVLVSNGVYETGGRAVYGAMTNRIAITNSMVVRSVNGPGVTIIAGFWDPAATNGNEAVRCAYVGTNSLLSGFTLTGGATRATGDQQREQSGGAVYGEAGAVISNCLLLGNAAYSGGGGAQGGLLRNCVLGGNRALARGRRQFSKHALPLHAFQQHRHPRRRGLGRRPVQLHAGGQRRTARRRLLHRCAEQLHPLWQRGPRQRRGRIRRETQRLYAGRQPGRVRRRGGVRHAQQLHRLLQPGPGRTQPRGDRAGSLLHDARADERGRPCHQRAAPRQQRAPAPACRVALHRRGRQRVRGRHGPGRRGAHRQRHGGHRLRRIHGAAGRAASRADPRDLDKFCAGIQRALRGGGRGGAAGPRLDLGRRRGHHQSVPGHARLRCDRRLPGGVVGHQ